MYSQFAEFFRLMFGPLLKLISQQRPAFLTKYGIRFTKLAATQTLAHSIPYHLPISHAMLFPPRSKDIFTLR